MSKVSYSVASYGARVCPQIPGTDDLDQAKDDTTPARLIKLNDAVLEQHTKVPIARRRNVKSKEPGHRSRNAIEIPSITEAETKVIPCNTYETHGRDGLVAWKSGPGRSKEWRKCSSAKRKTRRQACREKERRGNRTNDSRIPVDPHRVAGQEPVTMLRRRTDFKRTTTHNGHSIWGVSSRKKHFESDGDEFIVVRQSKKALVVQSRAVVLFTLAGDHPAPSTLQVDTGRQLRSSTADIIVSDTSDTFLTPVAPRPSFNIPEVQKSGHQPVSGTGANFQVDNNPFLFKLEQLNNLLNSKAVAPRKTAIRAPQPEPVKRVHSAHRESFGGSRRRFSFLMDYAKEPSPALSPSKAMPKCDDAEAPLPKIKTNNQGASKRKDGRKRRRGIHKLRIHSFSSLDHARDFLARRWNELSYQAAELAFPRSR
ncbi:hypothetical protein G7Z17_g86 [Cylindrodendrum hubeiense]|uniref:Uncharacterized protein n=1 Tax=Cylindrodendrum hubeiense TaxID=595255 RepID=A0A9P5LNF2_9HYPO|nr:hypothetical protein G7Z17_g86 [Cylindrodendrum hubeiense]